MKLDLPEDVIQGLPAPDSKGVVRINVGVRMSPDGSAQVVEINDTPVADEAEGEEPDEEIGGDDYSDNAASAPMPDTREVADEIYKS